jgi:AraC-like DNA-binding protein
MNAVFSMVQGEFGKAVVVEFRHSLVLHAHSEIQIGYWLEGGQCQGSVADESVVYDESHAVGVNCFQAHDLVKNPNQKPSLMLMLYFHESWFDQHFASQGGPVIFSSAQLATTTEIREQCAEVMQKIRASCATMTTCLEQDIKYLAQLTIDSNAQAVCLLSMHKRRKILDPRMCTALNYLREKFADPHVLKNLNNIAGVSRSRLYQLFKNKLQSSPQLILNALRLDLASTLMSNPKLDMSAVSSNSGFSTPANFSRFFRAHRGITPSMHKKAMAVMPAAQALKLST